MPHPEQRVGHVLTASTRHPVVPAPATVVPVVRPHSTQDPLLEKSVNVSFDHGHLLTDTLGFCVRGPFRG